MRHASRMPIILPLIFVGYLRFAALLHAAA